MQERGSGERVKHDIPTVLGLMRRGTLSNGEQMKPFSWLTITTKPKTREELRVERFFESCPFKTGAAGVGGFALGGAFGLFTAFLDPNVTGESPLATKMSGKQVAKEISNRGWSMAKNFGIFGAMFAATECLLESYRGKSDISNSVMSGCITGGLIGLRAGVKAALVTSAGFGAFSIVIDYFFLRR